MCSKEDGSGPDAARRAFLAGSLGVAIGSISPAFAQTGAAPSAPPPPTRVLDDPGVVHGPVSFTHNGQPWTLFHWFAPIL